MNISALVESVVDSKIQANELFTAHDITLELRNRGERVSHADVRNAVHDYYVRGGMGIGYRRTSISVPGENHISFKNTFLYHSRADNFTSYTGIRGVNQQVMPTVVPVANDSDDSTDGQVDNQAVVIPADLLD